MLIANHPCYDTCNAPCGVARFKDKHRRLQTSEGLQKTKSFCLFYYYDRLPARWGIDSSVCFETSKPAIIGSNSLVDLKYKNVISRSPAWDLAIAVMGRVKYKTGFTWPRSKTIVNRPQRFEDAAAYVGTATILHRVNLYITLYENKF